MEAQFSSVQFWPNWTALHWTELHWTELNWTWTELNWTEIELNWIELNLDELNWTELNWTERQAYAVLYIICYICIFVNSIIAIPINTIKWMKWFIFKGPIFFWTPPLISQWTAACKKNTEKNILNKIKNK